MFTLFTVLLKMVNYHILELYKPLYLMLVFQIRIIVSSFETRFVQTKKLIEDIKLKYLNYLKLEEGQFVTLKDLCEGTIININ